jgi:hypothetical protein
MKFLHTDRTNSVYLASCWCSFFVCSCSYCTTGPSGRFLFYAVCCLSEDRKMKILLKMSREILNIVLFLERKRQTDRCWGNFNFSCIKNNFCLQMLQFITTDLYNSDSDWLTPWDSHSWQAVSFSAGQDVPLILSKPEFTRIFLSAGHHLSLPWAISVQSISSHTIPLRSILILSPILRLGLPSVGVSLRFPIPNPYMHLSLICHTP